MGPATRPRIAAVPRPGRVRGAERPGILAATMSERLATLEALEAANAAGMVGDYLLGEDDFLEERPEDAARELSLYCYRFAGDKGAAYLTLAQARAALGDVGGARAALDAGVANAGAHRHRQLVEALEAERLRLEEAP